MRMVSILVSAALILFANIAAATPMVAVAPQYTTTHVYVPQEDFARFAKSFLATFGGIATKETVANVTPTPSTTLSQLLLSPVGTLSVFGFVTPIPAPFGAERNGLLVSDFDAAIAAARADGAGVIVAPFEDALGRDAILQWPGGVNMQLYWHRETPHYPALKTVPENRVYVAPEQADAFIHAFLAFSHGEVIEDNAKAPGIEIGEPFNTYRRVRIRSQFGNVTVLATDGLLPYPWGRETTGYEVADVDATILKAEAAGAFVIVEPFNTAERRAAFIRFPGGYIAEIHSP